MDKARKLKSKSVLREVCLLGALLSLLGCTQSPPPKVEELIKVSIPTFTGARVRSFTTPSHDFTLNGECDRTSRGLEYSTDNVTWTNFASSCPSGTFSVPLVATQGRQNFYIRALGKFTATEPATAQVRFVRPDTTPMLTMVNSSRSDSSDRVGPGTQNVVSEFVTGKTMSSATHRMQTHLPEVVYSE